MAIIHECDRCHTQSQDAEDYEVVYVPHVGREWQGSGKRDTYPRELCLSCLRKLAEFVKALPKVAQG